MSYLTDITKALSKFGTNSTTNPDAKHNTGRLLGEAFMWDEVTRYAEARAKGVWATLAKEGIVPEKSTLTQGEHELAYSPSFTVIARVSHPVRRFDGDELARLLKASKYRVPESTTKEMIDQAKVPTKSTVSMKVVERGS